MDFACAAGCGVYIEVKLAHVAFNVHLAAGNCSSVQEAVNALWNIQNLHILERYVKIQAEVRHSCKKEASLNCAAAFMAVVQPDFFEVKPIVREGQVSVEVVGDTGEVQRSQPFAYV